MRRRHFLELSALAVQAPRTKPNLIIFTNDQHRADCLGTMGNPVIRTPNVDRLAAEGALFEQHFVPTPQCVPSRVSLATGRYPHVHRTPSNAYLLPDDEQTLARILNTAGYVTAAVGEMPFAPQKYTGGFARILANGNDHAAYLEQRGWGGVSLSAERKAWLEKHRAEARTAFQASPVPWPAELDESNFFAGKAREFLRETRNGPFFLHVNFRRPHHPFDPPAPYDQKYAGAKFPASHRLDGEMANKPPQQQQALRSSVGFDLTTLTPAALDRVKSLYYGMIELNDEAIGMVLGELKRLNLEGDTVVVFNADHGEMLGDHGLLFKGGYFYDEVMRTPLVIRAPGRIPPGTRRKDLVESIDVLPTVLDFLGVPVPEGVQGRHLFSGRPKTAVFGEFPTTKMVRTQDWKLVHYVGAKYGELYDLRADPHELTNRYSDPAYAATRAELQGKLADWSIQSADPKRSPVRGNL